MGSFPRKKYGPVKPVKVKPVKVSKPDLRELRSIYKNMSKEGPWKLIDNICYAMHWWDNALVYITSPPNELSSNDAKRILKATSSRTAGVTASLESAKRNCFVDSIEHLEKLAANYLHNVPKIREAIKAANESGKKLNDKKEDLQPRFKKLLDTMHGMFNGKLLMVIVPDKLEGDNFYDLGFGRKFDHTATTIYYHKDLAKKLQSFMAKEGVMALAIQEAYWWSECTTSNPIQQAMQYQQLMMSFHKWAKNPKSPRTLVKRSKKKNVGGASPVELSEATKKFLLADSKIPPWAEVHRVVIKLGEAE